MVPLRTNLIGGVPSGDAPAFLACEEQARLGRREPPYPEVWRRLRTTHGAAHRVSGTGLCIAWRGTRQRGHHSGHELVQIGERAVVHVHKVCLADLLLLGHE